MPVTSDPVDNYLAATNFADDGKLDEALQCYLVAARGGHVEAKWCAGSMLVDDEGACGYRTLGLRLITAAAEEQSYDAATFLSDAFRYGLYGFEKDAVRSEEWRRQAQQHGQKGITRRVGRPMEIPPVVST